MPFPPDLLLRTPEEAVRRICVSFLEEANEASKRLDDPSDAEALHDFRVAVRRLRSTLRAWREVLEDSVKKRHRRALKELQNGTGAGRDAEVAIEWLRTQRTGLTPSHRRGLDWMVDRRGGRLREAMAHACEGVREAFHGIERDLLDAVETMHMVVQLSAPRAPRTFAALLAVKVREHTEELVRHLMKIASVDDRDESHEARIMGKRLRYLVEPVREFTPQAGKVVKRCKNLQDILGDLNDCHVLRDDLGDAMEQAAVEHARRLHELIGGEDAERLRQEIRRSHRPGLLELTRRVQQRGRGLYERLDAEWIADGAHDLLEETGRLASHLERLAQSDVEIERKYLLRGRPELPETSFAVEIDQGWLPGKRLRERLRRRTGPNGTEYFRTVKLGEGVLRTELEEETTEVVFEALWALTEGCRVRKRRHVVVDGAYTWEIDEFLDRDLWLAEVELSDPAEEAALPEWLAPHVVRDVTGVKKYVNLRLAR